MNGKVLGNLNHVGAKRHVKCDASETSFAPVTCTDGQWTRLECPGRYLHEGLTFTHKLIINIPCTLTYSVFVY